MDDLWHRERRDRDAHAGRPRRRLAALRHPGLPPRRHPQGARQGHRGQPLPHPGLPGRGHPPPGRRRPRDLHGPQGQLRRRRRAHLPGAHPGRSTRSRSSPAATSAAPSSTTCASCAARPPRSRSSATPPSPADRSPGRAAGNVTQPRRAEPPPVASAAGAGRARAGRRHRRARVLLVLVVVLATTLVRTFLVAPFSIPSGSMEQTLHVGDRILVDRLSYRFHDVRRGDIVVFDGTEAFGRLGDGKGETDYVKRVIGLPGDHVVVLRRASGDGVYGQRQAAATRARYLYPGDAPSELRFDVVVPAGPPVADGRPPGRLAGLARPPRRARRRHGADRQGARPGDASSSGRWTGSAGCPTRACPTRRPDRRRGTGDRRL